MYRIYRAVFVLDLHRRLKVQESLLLADVNTRRRHKLESDWCHDQVSVRGGTTCTSDRWPPVCVSYESFEHHFWVWDILLKLFWSYFYNSFIELLYWAFLIFKYHLMDLWCKHMLFVCFYFDINVKRFLLFFHLF